MNNSNSVRLEVKGLGHVPSFKNGKMLARGRLITDPKKQKWMDQCIRSFESQLRLIFRTKEGEIYQGHFVPSKIAWYLPLDDSVDWIVSESVVLRRTSKGEEGATIYITPIE